ncbi:MAG: endospore germination permease [Clostridiaceae bacterium]|nr:endospore germination permease [Clostridiaceae bacterium]
MDIDQISSKQASTMIALFIAGSSVIIGVDNTAQQDSWISFIIAVIIFIPIALVYARLLRLFPGSDIYDIATKLLGNVWGKIIIISLSWYAFHLGALVMRNISGFIGTVALTETPQLPLLVLMGLLSVYAIKCGMESFGKCTVIFIGFYIVVLGLILIFSIEDFNYTNLMPVMFQDVNKIMSGAYTNFTFPLGETVLFTTVLGSLASKASPTKVYIKGTLIGGTIVLISLIKNILIIGYPLLAQYAFPHYDSAKFIVIGGDATDAFARIEGSVAVVFFLTGFIKASVCLYAAAKGVAKTFHIDNYRKLVFPISIAMITLASTVYKSSSEMFDFISVYKYYAIPFQVILPLVLLVPAEIKIRKKPAPLKTQQDNG